MSATDLFEVLEVEPGASPQEIRRAYFRLAKQLHPDRQAAADPETTERFLSVQKAYEVLMDPKQRAQYERERGQAGAEESEAPRRESPTPSENAATYKSRVRKNGPTPEERRDARIAFERALLLVEDQRFKLALRTMQAVVKVVPDKPEYISLLGYVMAEEGDRLHAARDYCRRAVEAEPYNSDYHARLGFVYEKAGLSKTAQGCFERALQIDPQNQLALEHLAAGMSGESKKGLLGGIKRLFGG